MKDKILEPLKAFLKKLLKIREKTQYERKLRFWRSNPTNIQEFNDELLRIRGINAARKLEELKEARKLEEN